MITSTSKGAELRYPYENGGEGLAAHVHYRADSSHNYNVEIHVPDLDLLTANKADAAQNICEFFDACRAEIVEALGLETE